MHWRFETCQRPDHLDPCQFGGAIKISIGEQKRTKERMKKNQRRSIKIEINRIYIVS